MTLRGLKSQLERLKKGISDPNAVNSIEDFFAMRRRMSADERDRFKQRANAKVNAFFRSRGCERQRGKFRGNS